MLDENETIKIIDLKYCVVFHTFLPFNILSIRLL